ncbi:divalent cation tolerance protein CutA [Opitutales bacterium]|nr:divalent cation tolerance protein CutA [Opitutales bacterium]
METNVGIGLTTCPNMRNAKMIVRSLLESKIVSCGQVDGPILSIYTWQNDLVESEEWRVVLKFKIENHHDILKQIKILHEYDVPQWVYWESSSSKECAQWIHDPSAC